ncbi:MAG: hypothetical protein M3461_18810 [Pseudomonadota bacterium]|nr:hypothetical protein [Pseudomonadota bacterium]
MSPAELLRFLEEPDKLLIGLQHLIASSPDVPKLTSSVLAMWVAATYFDAEAIANMIEAVPPGPRKGLIELLTLIAKRPVPGSGLHVTSEPNAPVHK